MSRKYYCSDKTDWSDLSPASRPQTLHQQPRGLVICASQTQTGCKPLGASILRVFTTHIPSKSGNQNCQFSYLLCLVPYAHKVEKKKGKTAAEFYLQYWSKRVFCINMTCKKHEQRREGTEAEQTSLQYDHINFMCAHIYLGDSMTELASSLVFSISAYRWSSEVLCMCVWAERVRTCRPWGADPAMQVRVAVIWMESINI